MFNDASLGAGEIGGEVGGGGYVLETWWSIGSDVWANEGGMFDYCDSWCGGVWLGYEKADKVE